MWNKEMELHNKDDNYYKKLKYPAIEVYYMQMMKDLDQDDKYNYPVLGILRINNQKNFYRK